MERTGIVPIAKIMHSVTLLVYPAYINSVPVKCAFVVEAKHTAFIISSQASAKQNKRITRNIGNTFHTQQKTIQKAVAKKLKSVNPLRIPLKKQLDS